MFLKHFFRSEISIKFCIFLYPVLPFLRKKVFFRASLGLKIRSTKAEKNITSTLIRGLRPLSKYAWTIWIFLHPCTLLDMERTGQRMQGQSVYKSYWDKTNRPKTYRRQNILATKSIGDKKYMRQNVLTDKSYQGKTYGDKTYQRTEHVGRQKKHTGKSNL